MSTRRRDFYAKERETKLRAHHTNLYGSSCAPIYCSYSVIIYIFFTLKLFPGDLAAAPPAAALAAVPAGCWSELADVCLTLYASFKTIPRIGTMRLLGWDPYTQTRI